MASVTNTKPSSLRVLKQILKEVSLSALQDIRSCDAGGTHQVQTCRMGDESFYLKFGGWGDDSIEQQQEYNYQIGVEFIAYELYKLFGLKTPKTIHVVSDPRNKRLGLATSNAAAGGQRWPRENPTPAMRKSLTAGMFVDMFLANWDVKTANLFQSGDDAVRIDPGGALTFRAQGARKGNAFSDKPSEIRTMHPVHGTDPRPNRAAKLYDVSYLKLAAQTFAAVSKEQISQTIDTAARAVQDELVEAGMTGNSLDEWNHIVQEIKSKLSNRYDAVLSSVEFIEAQS